MSIPRWPSRTCRSVSVPPFRRIGTLRAGVGVGGGASYDPSGTSPDGGSCHGVSVGTFAEGGAHFGPFEAGLSSSSGYSQGSGTYATPIAGTATYSPSIAVGVGASGGVEISFH